MSLDAKIANSHTVNRYLAEWVKTRIPNHQTIWDSFKRKEKQQIEHLNSFVTKALRTAGSIFQIF